MQEILVVIACLSGKGCNETSNAYYQAHPELRKMVEMNEKKLKNFVGPIVVESAAPIAFVVAGGTGNFKLYGNFSVEIKQYTQPMLIFSKGF